MKEMFESLQMKAYKESMDILPTEKNTCLCETPPFFINVSNNSLVTFSFSVFFTQL